jgi:P27 family predicted phage terminase small subunit
VVEDLDERGLLKVSDVPIIASYARNVLLARLASRELEKRGILLDEQDKYHGVKTKQNPAVDILQRAQSAMEKTAIQLGLTPTGRKRLKGEEQVKSPLDAFMEEVGNG